MTTQTLNVEGATQAANPNRVADTPPGAALVKQVRLLGSQALTQWCHRPICTWLARLNLWSWGAFAGDRFRVRGHLRLHLSGNVQIGKDVRINSGPANFVGGDRKMALWVGPNARLTIEDGCALSNSTIVCHHEVVVLSHTFIGGGCEIYDTDFHPVNAEARIAGDPPPGGAIRIGPQAFIGARSLVLKNVVVGEGAVVASGSVVTRSVPPHELWGGIPARLIRRLK